MWPGPPLYLQGSCQLIPLEPPSILPLSLRGNCFSLIPVLTLGLGPHPFPSLLCAYPENVASFSFH